MARAVGISHTSVQNIWREHGLKPHLVDTFKVSNDPAFAATRARVLHHRTLELGVAKNVCGDNPPGDSVPRAGFGPLVAMGMTGGYGLGLSRRPLCGSRKPHQEDRACYLRHGF